MAEVHKLILQHGAAQARLMMADKAGKQRVNIASEFLASEFHNTGFTYSGFALTTLPHKNPTTDVWRREGLNVTLTIQSGVDRLGKTIGIPFGAHGRLILFYLQTEAVKTQSREVELGRNMKKWLENMGLKIGGETYRTIRDQAARISSCNLVFHTDKRGAQIRSKGSFVKTEISMSQVVTDGEQRSLWNDTVILDDEFYRALKEHPVPLNEAAIRGIKSNSMALDVYVWLTYRLHHLEQSQTVRYEALRPQFGPNFARMRQFRTYFKEVLEKATAVYPEAKVELTEEGVMLHPLPSSRSQKVDGVGIGFYTRASRSQLRP